MPSGSARTGSLVTTSAFPPSGWSAPTTRACTSTHPGRTSRSASAHRAAASCPGLADHLAGVKRARAPKRLKLCYSFVLRTLAYMVLLSRGLQFRHPSSEYILCHQAHVGGLGPRARFRIGTEEPCSPRPLGDVSPKRTACSRLCLTTNMRAWLRHLSTSG